MRSLAQEEYQTLSASIQKQLYETLPTLLVPVSPSSSYSALVELKAGVGGSEAALFLADLLRVYLRYASQSRWQTKFITNNITENGGVKEAAVEVVGNGAYDTLRWESGVHRVQRVPATETKGRTHTSTVSVVVRSERFSRYCVADIHQVLPLLDEADAQADSELYKMEDVKVEVMRARGAGGQVFTLLQGPCPSTNC